MNLNVRKGDNVKVLTGKDKGKTGKVLATDPKTGKVLVEGVNIATHHLKARAAGQQSSIKKVEAPLDGSNVQIVCPSCNKNARVRHQKIDGKNVRICAKCGASLDVSVKADKKKKADKTDKAKKPAKKKADDKAEKVEKTVAPEADAAAETVATEATAEKKPAAKKPAAKKPAAKKPAAKKVPVEESSDGKTEKE